MENLILYTFEITSSMSFESTFTYVTGKGRRWLILKSEKTDKVWTILVIIEKNRSICKKPVILKFHP